MNLKVGDEGIFIAKEVPQAGEKRIVDDGEASLQYKVIALGSASREEYLAQPAIQEYLADGADPSGAPTKGFYRGMVVGVEALDAIAPGPGPSPEKAPSWFPSQEEALVFFKECSAEHISCQLAPGCLHTKEINQVKELMKGAGFLGVLSSGPDPRENLVWAFWHGLRLGARTQASHSVSRAAEGE